MALTVTQLTKRFGGELALDAVDLDVAAGEIHALLGPNGSGKSTLIGCLSGRLVPDGGSMTIGEQRVDRFTPRSAFASGTAVIYQHFSLIPSLSVTDNIFLGSERRSLGRVDQRRQRDEAAQLLSRLGVHADLRAPVHTLSVGEKQLVEIVKAMRHEPTLLILDEPTAALGEVEARLLGEQLLGLRDSGLAVLYVTHHVSEVFEIADRVTVLRDGQTVLSAATEDLSPDRVIAAIAPQHTAKSPRARDAAKDSSEPVLELVGFTSPGVDPVDLSVGTGEVLGVFGLLGSGRSELLEGLYGLRGQTGGEARLSGAAFSPTSPAESLSLGLALVPSERGRQGIFAPMSALDNVLLPYFHLIGRWWWRNRSDESRSFRRTADLVALKPVDERAHASTYSGGNQQKLVVGRWLTDESSARMLLLDEPTQGIDVGARADLYDLIRRFVQALGRGVLFTSSDPEEVEALADRAVVLARGRVVAELEGGDITARRLLDLAHGSLSALQPHRGTYDSGH